MNYGYYPYSNYQQQYGQPQDQLAQLRQGYQIQQNQQNQQQQDERIWVQGRASAEAYLVAPNSFVRLWDSSQNYFYEKHADSSGRPYMETYEYKQLGSDIPNNTIKNNTKAIDYINQLKALEKRIEALEGGMNHAESNANDTTV